MRVGDVSIKSVNNLSIIGVLNVTPDSFYDGGRYATVEEALRGVEELLSEGADWIEVGGQSTGPKSKDVSVEEEIRRVIPVVEAIRKHFPAARISVDTFQSEVAAKAIAAGAMMINDVTAGRGDPDMFSAIRDASVKLVLMHAKDATPRTTIQDVQYDDVVGTVKDFVTHRKSAALAAGISSDRIILDPGLGHFVSSDATYSFEILERLREFTELGCPVLVSPSRKSFLAGRENLPVVERLPGTIAASVIAALNGAAHIRTHDVKEVKRGCEIALFTRRES